MSKNRKCGRVVCASCSPHRITIPYQYIVQPPGQPQRYSGVFLGGEGSLVDFNSVGGGERVRLCNPCVPDPNITPPNQVTGGPGVFPQRAHYRSQSSTGGTHPGDMSSRALAGSAADYSRSRSVTVVSPSRCEMTGMKANIVTVQPDGQLSPPAGRANVEPHTHRHPSAGLLLLRPQPGRGWSVFGRLVLLLCPASLPAGQRRKQ